MLNEMFKEIINEINGYVTTFVYDCDNDTGAFPNSVFNQKTTCKLENFQPTFRLIRPPEMSINPYTGASM